MPSAPETAHQVANRYQPGHPHQGNNCRVQCPVHKTADSGNHCSIFDGDNGGIYARCHSRECEWRDILSALGLSHDQQPRRDRARCGLNDCRSFTDTLIAIYDNRDGGQRCVHRRECDGPGCTWPDCDGSDTKHVWGRGSPEGCYLLPWGYDDPDNVLVLVEGEKAAAALQQHVSEFGGITPVTWRGGAGKEHMAVWDMVKDRIVLLWPDNDPWDEKLKKYVGLEAMKDAAVFCKRAGAELIQWIDVSSLPEKADAADVDAATAIDLIDSAATLEVEDPEEGRQPPESDEESEPNIADQQVEMFGPEGDMNVANPRAFSSTGDAVRLLMFVPENLMVAFQEDEDVVLRVCDPETGVWRSSHRLIGLAIEQAVELWSRVLVAEGRTVNARQKLKFWTWTNRTRGPVGRASLLESIPAAVGVLEKYQELDDLKEKGLVVCKDSDVDSTMRYLGAANGVIDLDTGELLDPEEGRKHLVSMSTLIPYKPFAHIEQTEAADDVQQLLDHLEEDEQTWVEGFLGHAMRGSPDGCAWIVGSGNSGKTTLLESVVAALGQYAFVIPENLLESKISPSDHSEGMHLFSGGARLAVASDILAKKANISAIKRLATGDMQTFRRTHGRYESENTSNTVTASMILAFNDNATPDIPLDDDGFERRLKILRYPSLSDEKRRPRAYRDKLKTAMEHRQAILAWLVDCAVRHREIPANTPDGRELVANYRRDTVGTDFYDYLTGLIEQTNEIGHTLGREELWQRAVKDHGVDGKVFGMSKNTWTRRVKDVFPTRTTRRLWIGLKYRDEPTTPTQGSLSE